MRADALGRALVEECCTRADQLRCARLELTSKLAREESHTFYERVGFEHTAKRFTKRSAASEGRPGRGRHPGSGGGRRRGRGALG